MLRWGTLRRRQSGIVCFLLRWSPGAWVFGQRVAVQVFVEPPRRPPEHCGQRPLPEGRQSILTTHLFWKPFFIFTFFCRLTVLGYRCPSRRQAAWNDREARFLARFRFRRLPQSRLDFLHRALQHPSSTHRSSWNYSLPGLFGTRPRPDSAWPH